QGVPVVRRANETDIEVLLLQHLAIVAVQPRALFRFLPLRSDVRGFLKLLLINVTERDNLNGRDLDQAEQVALTIPAAADETDAPGLLVGDFLGEKFSLSSGGDGESSTSSGGRGVDELAAVHGELRREERSTE